MNQSLLSDDPTGTQCKRKILLVGKSPVAIGVKFESEGLWEGGEFVNANREQSEAIPNKCLDLKIKLFFRWSTHQWQDMSKNP